MRYISRFNPDSISNKILLDELAKLSKKLNKTPTRENMKNGTSITKRLYLYDRNFGGLINACKQIGLKPNVGGAGCKYSEEELLEHILELQRKLNKTPTQKDINNEGKYTIGAYKRHFGSYNNALNRLNIKHNIKFNVSEQEIIEDIIRVANILGRSPKANEFAKLSNTVSHNTACNKLNCKDNWNAILKKCGLVVEYNKNLSAQELSLEIEKLYEKLGRLPGYYDMMQYGQYSPETYARRYGTYTKALLKFGYNYIPKSQWHNQKHTKGKDGNFYKSKFEAGIANNLYQFLKDNKIISYEYEKIVCEDRKWTCDFYILISNNNAIWLEADGMGKNRKDPYNEYNEKIEFYKNNNYMYAILPYRKTNLKETMYKIISNNISNSIDCLDTELII